MPKTYTRKEWLKKRSELEAYLRTHCGTNVTEVMLNGHYGALCKFYDGYLNRAKKALKLPVTPRSIMQRFDPRYVHGQLDAYQTEVPTDEEMQRLVGLKPLL